MGNPKGAVRSIRLEARRPNTKSTMFARPMASPRMWLTAILSLTLITSACASSSTSNSAVQGVSLPDGGTLFLGVGPSERVMNLWRLRGDGHSVPEQLTNQPAGRGISQISAGSGQVFVTEASTGHDRIARLTSGGLEPAIGGRVFNPVLSNDGRLAYARLRDSSDAAPSSWSVVVRDLVSGQERTVFTSSEPLVPDGWGPSGLAVAQLIPKAQGGGREYLIGEDSRRTILEEDFAGIRLSRRGTYVIQGTLLVDPSSRERRQLPSGWYGIAWSPDGDWLLLVEAAEGHHRLALYRVDDNSLHALVTLQLSVQNAAWGSV